MDAIDVDDSEEVALDIVETHLSREGFSASILFRVSHIAAMVA